jgi:hypothetical protein
MLELEGRGFQLYRQKGDEVEPGQLVSRLLTKSDVGAVLGEIAQVFHVAGMKPIFTPKWDRNGTRYIND